MGRWRRSRRRGWHGGAEGVWEGLPDGVAVEAFLDPREGAPSLRPEVIDQARPPAPREHAPARVGDQRAVGAHHRRRGREGLHIVGFGSRLRRQQLREAIGEPLHDLALPRDKGRAARDDPPRLHDRLRPLPRRQVLRGLDDAAAKRLDRRFARGPAPHRLEKLLLEELHPGVKEVLLGGEVVEDRHLGHVRRVGDLGHGDRLEAALVEELARGLEDLLPRFLLLALAQAGSHGRQSTGNSLSRTIIIVTKGLCRAGRKAGQGEEEMSWYSIALFVHVVGALLLFGLLTLEGFTLRTGATAARLNRVLGPISALAILVPGVYMVVVAAGWTGWAAVGLGTYVLIAGIGAYTGISVLRGRMSSRAAPISWLVHTGMALGVVFDMTVKPDRLSSVVAVAVGVAVALVAVPAVRTTRTT